MADRISHETFLRMMADPETPEHALRPYLKVAEETSGPFNPQVVPNPETVDVPESVLRAESALGFGNGFCRLRRRTRFERRLRAGDRSPVLVSEGDSWFQFPFLIEDVVDHLSRDFLVWSLGAAGDTAQNMVFAAPEFMQALDEQAERVQAFLFSAAGNDILGTDRDGNPVLGKLLKQSDGSEPPEALIDRDRVAETLRFLENAYRTVIRTIRADARFERLPIIVHGYDYPFPGNPDDPRDPIYAGPDQWLGKPLRERGIVDPDRQRAVLRLLLDELYGMLGRLAGEPAASGVFVVDLRGTLDRVDDWADEIHATDDGFAKVAAGFREVLDGAIGRDARSEFARRRVEAARAAPRVPTAPRAEPPRARIVLDPGHGGDRKVGGSSPNNATGPNGTRESALTLEVARAAERALSERGHHVLMTRKSDRNVGLAKRARAAFEAEADVFVSIHFNGWSTPDVQGTETYCGTSATGASTLLARHVQRSVRAATGLRDRGVKTADFGVIEPTRHLPTTAACLTEISFITDPEEEARLGDPAYVRRLAGALADGIEAYLAEGASARAELYRAPAPSEAEALSDVEYGCAPDLPQPAGPVTLDAFGRAFGPARSPAFARAPSVRQAVSAAPSRIASVSDPARFLAAWRDRRREGADLPPQPRLERAIGRDDSLPYLFLQRGADRGRAVCKIEASGVDYVGRPGSWVGSGFLVAPNVLLTNHHVINAPAVAETAQALFAYELASDGSLSPVKAFRLDPTRLFLTSLADGGLDYTFVWIEGQPHEEFGVIPLERGAFTIAENERANVIHHPAGQPKRVSLQDNKILDFHEVMLHYASDTEGGSSGAPVLDNTWRLIALHHAWQDLPEGLVAPTEGSFRYINEGVKISAITVDLETRLSDRAERAAASLVLEAVSGSDSITGYFGALGRRSEAAALSYERVVDVYQGTAQDIDVAFWNVEWFNRRFRERVGEVARIVADLNLDIWAFEETSPEATQALVDRLADEFGQIFEWAASEPDASSGRQTTTVIWNPATVEGERRRWPDEIDEWLRVDSRKAGSLRLEAVEGKVFDRYPGLFHFKALDRPAQRYEPFDFHLVPLHLKAKDEGAKRRRLASRILSAAVRRMIERHSADHDWLIGGDVNAELATDQFAALTDAGFTAMSATDEAEGALSYLKGPRSLIDTIFLSPSLSGTYGADDFFIYARDATKPDYVKTISDHRPVMARLSLRDRAATRDAPEDGSKEDGTLRDLLRGDDGETAPAPDEAALLDALLARVRSDPEDLLRDLAERLARSRRR